VFLLLGGAACTAATPHSPSPKLLHAAKAATDREDWRAAAHFWNQAISQSTEPGPRPYLEAGRAMWKLEDVEAAQAFLDRGIQLFPGDIELHMLRGKLLCSRGFRRAAESDFLEVTELQPDHTEAWLLLGQVLLDLSLPVRAAVCLQHHVRLQGPSEEALFMLGQACAEGGDLAPAMESFGAALSGWDAPPDRLVEAAIHVTDERFEETRGPFLDRALAWVDRALAIDPQHAEGHFVRGRLLEFQGDEEGALGAYLRAVELDNFHLLAMTHAAEIYARRGDVAGADRLIDRALDLNIAASRRSMLERLRESWH
jgi:tetratricopeptide (TPR) repeat protein